jgi:hypothetical protein
MRGRLKDIHADILAVLRGFQPDSTSNGLIWALNRIRPQSIHRLIVPATLMSAGMLIQHMSMTTATPLDIPGPLQWNSLN